MELFDLQTIGGLQVNVKVDGVPAIIKVIKAELLYEVIRAHTLLLEHPEIAGTANLLDLFTGFVGTPYHISWYSSSTHENPPMRAVMQCIKEGNSIVVVERLPPKDPISIGTVIDK